MRWHEPFERWRSSLDWIADSDAVRIAMPQDEYVCSATLDEWLGELEVDCVFSVLDSRHWPVLYPGESQRTRIERTYTGFVDDRAAGSVQQLPGPHGTRELDTHYFPLRGDFSNLPEALERVRDPRETEAMAERAWEDLIASGRYSYGAFAAHVESVVDELAGGRVRRGHRSVASWRMLGAASDLHAGVRIPAPRLGHRTAIRHVP